MKRIIAFILCLVMAFSLCACKGDEPAPSTEPTAEPTPASSSSLLMADTRLPAEVALPTLSVGYPTAQQIIDSGCDFLYASSWIFDDELTVAQLEKAGITVYVSEAETIEAVWQELRDLGKVFLVDNIEEIVSEQCTRLEAVTDKLGEVTEPKSVFVLDSVIGDKLYTAGGTNIESAYIAAAGGVNAMSELTKAWDAVSR